MEDEKLLNVIRKAVREEIQPLEGRVAAIETERDEYRRQQSHALTTLATGIASAHEMASKAMQAVDASKDANAKMVSSALAIHEKAITDKVGAIVNDATSRLEERTQNMARELGVPDDDGKTPGQLTRTKSASRLTLAVATATTVLTIIKLILEQSGHH